MFLSDPTDRNGAGTMPTSGHLYELLDGRVIFAETTTCELTLR